jgi:predicted dehydrogenase
MSKTYRVGLVGCGGMGRHHLNVLNNLPEFEIAAVCDLLPDALNKWGDEYGVAARYTDCNQMYDEANLELVTVATQTRGHHIPTVAALQRGIPVMCEKPIAIDLVEADEMVGAAEQSGAKFAIHQQNHVNPGIRKAQAMVADGAIGEVVLVRGRNKAGRKSGNEFMEMGTHVTDMMLCFGGIPQWCSGTIYVGNRPAEREDIMEAKEMSPGDRDSGLVAGTRAVAQYGFRGGAFGEVHFIDYRPGMSDNYGVDILGSEGQLAVRSSATVAGGNLWHLPRPMEGTPAQLSDWQQVDLSDIGVEEPVITMYRGLIRAVETDTQPPSSGEEGRWAFEMIMGIYQSHREGRRVELPLADRRHPLEQWRDVGH